MRNLMEHIINASWCSKSWRIKSEAALFHSRCKFQKYTSLQPLSKYQTIWSKISGHRRTKTNRQLIASGCIKLTRLNKNPFVESKIKANCTIYWSTRWSIISRWSRSCLILTRFLSSKRRKKFPQSRRTMLQTRDGTMPLQTLSAARKMEVGLWQRKAWKTYFQSSHYSRSTKLRLTSQSTGRYHTIGQSMNYLRRKRTLQRTKKTLPKAWLFYTELN